MAERVSINNQGYKEQSLVASEEVYTVRLIITTALLVSLQQFREGMYEAVSGPSTPYMVISIIKGSYCRRRRRLTIFEPDDFAVPLTDILDAKYHPILTEFKRPCQ